ncbi:MAG: hypothetical protein Q4P78_04920 [Rothia sp. (in: high G+C Gram-positive bacteria)]|uniref:hypothetical protein n=1 Tax=Rothia sp. (in: high G+C Gram-positive bacteria) TaxID=1885016 RepID=UPI0026DF9388|nr:hypothetical protein [Rothia sp. (in: high G+C Gram-positive bacteria)]MDO5750529.1 hypothetical protein [Rothia sp. (in: high G+C Gram-positive bacteria)]
MRYMKMSTASVKAVTALLLAFWMLLAGSCPSNASNVSTSGDSVGIHEALRASGFSVLDPQEIIQQDIQRNPREFAEKLEMLRSSNALMDLYRDAENQNAVDENLRFLAAASSKQQVINFLQKTEGKKFLIPAYVTTSADIQLVDAEEFLVVLPQGLDCPAAWVAAFAYFAATEMTCIPVGLLTGGVGGFICNGIFFAIGNLPDFNKACRK